ncbi:putative lrr receptor-like serine/threonine-protein kinase, partial [Quercus suber]
MDLRVDFINILSWDSSNVYELMSKICNSFSSTIHKEALLVQTLTMGGNMIHSDIPVEIENLVNLNDLGLEYNYLGGTLPNALGKLQKSK